MNKDVKPDFKWWLKLIYAIIGAIIGFLGEAITGVAGAAFNALF